MWRPLQSRTVRWKSLEGEGLEHLVLEPHPDRIEACSVVIGERGGKPYGARYRITCALDWRVTEFGVTTVDNRALSLFSPEPGRWIDAAGGTLAHLDGAVDIDLAATPFTNTLPVRRLGLLPDSGTVELEMVYVAFDTLEPYRDTQRYTCLVATSRYLFEAADGSFRAEIDFDEDGLVTDYPALFRRA